MNALDLALVAMAIAAVVAGYRLGFTTRVLSWIGLAAGLVLGIKLLPWVLDRLGGSARGQLILVALAVVLAGAVLGQTVGSRPRGALRSSSPIGCGGAGRPPAGCAGRAGRGVRPHLAAVAVGGRDRGLARGPHRPLAHRPSLRRAPAHRPRRVADGGDPGRAQSVPGGHQRTRPERVPHPAPRRHRPGPGHRSQRGSVRGQGGGHLLPADPRRIRICRGSGPDRHQRPRGGRRAFQHRGPR